MLEAFIFKATTINGGKSYMSKIKPKNRRLQKNQIREKVKALIMLDELIESETDKKKLEKLKNARKEVCKLCR